MSLLILWADQDRATPFQIRQSIFKTDIRELLVAKMRKKMVRQNGLIPPIVLRSLGFKMIRYIGTNSANVNAEGCPARGIGAFFVSGSNEFA